MKQKINDLQKKVAELMEWKSINNFQQFSIPLGNVTKNIIRKDRMVLSKNTFTESGQFETAIETTLNGKTFFIIASTTT